MAAKKLSATAMHKEKPHEKNTEDLMPKPFPIVGFGASAGGIEAFTKLLQHLDDNLGMAYVLVMHLSPKHKSALKDIMQLKTKMRVQTVEDGMEVMANNVYVIPPNTFMSLVDGHLRLAPRSLSNIDNSVIDYFLATLASVYKNNAIGVILSGTASDGTLGLKAIKAEGGITFAQDETAEFSGMPRSAADSGFVDFRLSPEEIADELAKLVKMPYTNVSPDKIETEQLKNIDSHKEKLKQVLAVVRNKSGVDFFNNYKKASIYRRIMRRMALNKFNEISDYYNMLKTNPKEVDLLYDDFLINVTNFFRDPDFYKTLNTTVFPSIIKHKKSSDVIRIWVAGCSTGEEAYSVAISLIEFLSENPNKKTSIQIFASDLDENAIELARLGVYPSSALQDIPKKYIEKYFIKINNHYQIVKSVRELCVFSRHNLLSDPPFSRIDLISCQNVLIYLEVNPQEKILQTFHYALNDGGYLFLGKSETIAHSSELFEHIDKKIKVYVRKFTTVPQLDFTAQNRGDFPSGSYRLPRENTDESIEKVMSKLLLSRFVYPCVVVNKSFTIVQFYGITSPYLEPVAGKASLNILKMVKEDLVVELGVLLQEARKTGKIVIKEGIRLYTKQVMNEISIEVIPNSTVGDLYFLVIFKENAIAIPTEKTADTRQTRADQKEKTINKLKHELHQSRALIRTTNEEYETTYEELQANNEEILSSNEELQSVNEELESSKEELQSTIEELVTTNNELAKRNTELSESQQALKKINEQLEQYAFISSHDLQEPLRKISIFTDILLNHEESVIHPFTRSYLEKIGNSSKRMSALLKGLLPFSMIKKHEYLNLTVVDLNEIVKNVIEDFELVIETTNAVINIESMPTLICDAIQINQLFYNLIGNALKFSKENPVINVSSKMATYDDYSDHPELLKSQQYVAIKISDNGIGFNEKFVANMFTLLHRLNNSDEIGGTGVGLAICKKIVENHNGLISAKGIENVGATFTVFLPVDENISHN